MDSRYENAQIVQIWSKQNKLRLWQETELAVIFARVKLGLIDFRVHDGIATTLNSNPINVDWWLQRDQEVKHDLNAFIDERLRFLPVDLQQYFHQGMTSYDTEEPAFARMLADSLKLFGHAMEMLEDVLVGMARRYRYTIMLGRTHGQWAELQSFGKRCLTWLAALRVNAKHLVSATKNLQYSRLSGAIGSYGNMSPEVEKQALAILDFDPFYGATQIMPRELYAPVAQALCQTVLTLDKIALDIRLGARSGRPIYQEPFGKKQKGSSAMPHKKNPISTEQMEGMARMAQGYSHMIQQNIVTWEERAIEQSSVERVAWPDLFHVALHGAKTMTRVLEGLQVYPDHMLLEIHDSRGCYAAGHAKTFLGDHGAKLGLSHEDAYRIVQLAAFNAFEPAPWQKELRKNPPTSMEAVEYQLFYEREPLPRVSIRDIIACANLEACEQLEASEHDVARWNGFLETMFDDMKITVEWLEVFRPAHCLQGEDTLYREILGE